MGLYEFLFFFGFIVVIGAILLLDLGVFEKDDKEVTFKRAAIMTASWVTLALAFFFFIRYQGHWIHGITDMASLQEVAQRYHSTLQIQELSYQEALTQYQHKMSLEYITGYLIEYSLSIDNIFVMILIFTSFAVPSRYYKRVLMWGVLGAIIMRFIFIFSAGVLIQKYAWVLYVFGAFLIYSGIKMYLQRNKPQEMNPSNHHLVKFLSKHFNISSTIEGHNFVRRINGKRYITPLLLCLIVIEFTDVIFAVDSIPAIFGVTQDPYVVFFSNIFAILGLRSLFFVISKVMHMFRYLKIGLSVLLCFIGVKMLAEHWLETIGFETIHSLFAIVAIIAISILFSIIIPEKKSITDSSQPSKS